MKRTFKKIVTTSFFSLALVAGTITGFNSINLASYNEAYKSDKEIKADWLNKNSNIKSIKSAYDSYDYTFDQYQKDQVFFSEVFKKDFYHPGHHDKIQTGYIDYANSSIIDYLTAYKTYNGNTDTIKAQKKLNNEWKNGTIDPSKYYDLYQKNKHYNYSNNVLKSRNIILYYANFKTDFLGPDTNNNIENFNLLFKTNNLPQFIFKMSDIEKNSEQNRESSLKQDNELAEKNIEEQNKDFYIFLEKYKRNTLNEQEKYAFFKTLNFINYTMNQKINLQNKTSKYINLAYKNQYFAAMIGLIDYSTKYYDHINEDIAIDKNLSEAEKNDLNMNF